MNEKYLIMAENGRCYFLYYNFCIIYVLCIELFSYMQIGFLSAEEIRCIFDDDSKIIFVKSS